jgi:hypothetical protein
LGFNYSVFGLFLHSNLSLPGLADTDSTAGSPDIELHLGISANLGREPSSDAEELTYESSSTTETGESALQVWRIAKGAFLRVAYSDGTQFWIDRGRKNIWATWSDRSSLENTASYLLGPVLGLVLRLRGVTCLHASAVSIEDRSVAFVGSAGAGKSTTAAAFARQGYGVITDDIVALLERGASFHVMPAYPHLSLWPDSVKTLYGSSEVLPRFIPDWEKRCLALGDGGTSFENRSLPLGAIYVLGERREVAAPLVEAMRPQGALLLLVAETYANKILDQDMRAREFDVLGRLVTTVPVRRVYPHREATRLEELCTVILKDYASLDLPTAPVA